ncbi:MAG: outer membrane beta-barrel protein [Chitinophagaceae bacterium]|nr:outer membrane beta-barrel protein [Chitinophagaceae bacterium]
MKRLLLIISLIVCGNFLFAQTETDSIVTVPVKKKWNKDQLSRRAADHFMIQLGYYGWSNIPDTIRTGGLSRTFNFHFMFDFPFKSDPRFSAAIGLGLGTDNIFFKQTTLDLRKYPLNFAHDTVTQYKRYKLATTHLEVPLEIRFASNPANYNKTFKAALGVKVGTMIDAHTKAKITRDREGYGSYTARLKDRRNFNSTRLAGTVRVGYGAFSIFGTYQFNEFIREGAGPDVRPYTIGIALSGL